MEEDYEEDEEMSAFSPKGKVAVRTHYRNFVCLYRPSGTCYGEKLYPCSFSFPSG